MKNAIGMLLSSFIVVAMFVVAPDIANPVVRKLSYGLFFFIVFIILALLFGEKGERSK
jgi:hypothetical protein